MKCSYCGNELEKGAEFCPECGMILGLNETREEKNSAKQEPEFKVPEYTPNVFKAMDIEEEADAPAAELEADTAEETVEVAESIPEFVAEAPEYVPAEISEFEDISSGDETEEDASEAEEEADEIQEEAEEVEETEEAEEPEAERVPEAAVTYPEYADFAGGNQENEIINPTEEEYEEIGTDDIYVKPSSKKGPLVAVLLIALICVIVGGVYAVKNFVPVEPSEPVATTDVQAGADVTEGDTTAAATTEAEEVTTEAEETSEAEEVTTEAETEAEAEEEEEEPSTTKKVTTTKKKVTTTKAPSTTKKKVTTTKAPSTTKKQTTTKKPSTTKIPADSKMQPVRPAYTGAFGINDVPVKQPKKRYSKAVIRYCTEEGVVLRSRPSSSSARVLYFSKGADLTVYAKENGFYYVKSNRYGVYGWISEKYTSKTRPEAKKAKVYKNTVKPDAEYEKKTTKHTVDGVNIRKGPGTKYSAIRIIPIKYPVEVIGYKKGVKGWVYVKDTTYGIYGWVSSKYIK